MIYSHVDFTFSRIEKKVCQTRSTTALFAFQKTKKTQLKASTAKISKEINALDCVKMLTGTMTADAANLSYI